MDGLNELKEWTIKEVNSINKDYHNDCVHMWNKGFKKGLLEVLDMINKIEKSNIERGEKY